MSRKQLPLLLVLTMLPLVTPQASIVTLPSGRISGTEKSLPANVASMSQLQGRDTTYREYLGIPFADPPVGNLRFKPPQPLSATWSEIRDATVQNSGCMQPITMISTGRNYTEDCLYLNIWAPGDGSSSQAKAVMVWIHGGGYVIGSTELYDGTMLAVIGDVIVVSVNYRVGIFGFLSTGDDIAPGNMGLLDQQHAIRWVKDNIALFGGDPERITIFGESAGASSATLQAISPTNAGLFKRVISQSGTLFSDWAVQDQEDMLTILKDTGGAVGCNDVNNADLVECLQGIDAQVLLTASLQPPSLTGANWGPVVDKKFIIDHPMKMLDKDSGPDLDVLKNTELMIGINSDEGYMLLASIYLPGFGQEGPISFETSTFDTAKSRELLQNVASKYGDTTVADTLKAMLSYTYFGPHGDNELDKETMLDIGHDFVTDALFLVPAVQLANLHIKVGGLKSYAYHMIHRGPNVTAPAWVEGADHAADLQYIFPPVELFPNVLDTERVLMYNMITYWSNFAKTGNPNEPAANPALAAEWPPFTEETSQYLNLGNTIVPSRAGAVIKSDRVNFWTDFVPKIIENAKCSKENDGTKKCDGETSNVPVYKASPLMMIVMLLYLYA